MSANETQSETTALAPRVLVAEDSAVNQRLLELLVTDLGYQADIVGSGRDACLAAGMDEFLGKPVDRERLRAALGRWITGSRDQPRAPQPGPAFDQAETLARFGNSADLLIEVVAVFLAEYPRLLEAVRTAAAGRDAGALERAAHKLAGALGNFRAVAAFEATRHLEHVARAGTLDAIPAGLADVEGELARLLPELQTLQRPS